MIGWTTRSSPWSTPDIESIVYLPILIYSIDLEGSGLLQGLTVSTWIKNIQRVANAPLQDCQNCWMAETKLFGAKCRHSLISTSQHNRHGWQPHCHYKSSLGLQIDGLRWCQRLPIPWQLRQRHIKNKTFAWCCMMWLVPVMLWHINPFWDMCQCRQSRQSSCHTKSIKPLKISRGKLYLTDRANWSLHGSKVMSKTNIGQIEPWQREGSSLT